MSNARSLEHAAIDPRQETDERFYKRVRPFLKELEGIRRKKLAQYKRRRAIGIPLGMVLTPICGYLDYLLLLMQRGSDESGAGVTLLVLGALYAWVMSPKRQYAKAYKTDILPRIARFLGDLDYKLGARIDMAKMEPSKIVPRHNRYKSDDYFSGRYKGIDLEIAEIHLRMVTGSGKRRRSKTVFKGLAILLELPSKRFYGHTVLTRNREGLNRWLKEKSLDLERAKFVDPEFEDVFDCFTNDQVEARYLLDPAMMEDIKAVHAEFGGKQLTAAYYDRQMLIMIATPRNHFEPADISVEATDREALLDLKNDVAHVFSIIDQLDLYDPRAVHKADLREDVLEKETAA